MSDEITASDVDRASVAVSKMLITEMDSFNRLDAATGDGDMGSTLAAVARAILAEMEAPSADVGLAFRRIAQAIAKTSGSSLSAIAMTMAMGIARHTQGRVSVSPDDLIAGCRSALDTAQQRSGAAFGDKTVLDGIKAVVDGVDDAASKAELAARSRYAIDQCLALFRSQPIRVGRARLSANQGVGTDDPGTAVLARMISAISAQGD